MLIALPFKSVKRERRREREKEKKERERGGRGRGRAFVEGEGGAQTNRIQHYRRVSSSFNLFPPLRQGARTLVFDRLAAVKHVRFLAVFVH